MTIAYERFGVTVHAGNCLDILPTLADASVDSIATDPPYELGFMGRGWDSSGIAFNVDVWRECLRVLKPGGHLLAFGGSRTWHRLAVAIEDAGFELRDSIAWLYGTGFPKSVDVSKAIDKSAGAEREVVGQRDRYRDGRKRQNLGDRNEVFGSGLTANGVADITAPSTGDAQTWQGWGTALKPAFEPLVVARKPLQGTVAANVLAHGTGALNIDGCRVPLSGVNPSVARRAGATSHLRQHTAAEAAAVGALESRQTPEAYRRERAGELLGRWPTNVVLTHAATPDGADACADGCIDGCPVVVLDDQSGTSTSRSSGPRAGIKGDGYRMTATGTEHDDEGGASRFFPVFRWEAKAPTSERPRVNGVAHPTVKPLALMRWLVRLVTPPGGLVLDPFLGSGTTAQAARAEGFRCIGIELELDHLPLIVARLDARPPTAIGAERAVDGEPLDLLDLLDNGGAAPSTSASTTGGAG